MSCKLILSDEGPFYAGGVVEGNLICILEKRTTILAIGVEAKGEESTECASDPRYSAHFTGSHTLFNLVNKLFPRASDRDSELDAGTYTFTFDIFLPSYLPNSFRNIYGQIKYSLKGIVMEQSKTYNQEIVLHVISLYDLNELTPELHNIVTYFTYPCTKEITEVQSILSSGGSGVKAHKEEKKTIFLNIPHTCFVPNFRGSKLFHIEWILEVSASLSGCNPKMCIRFEIYLGHVPHEEFTPKLLEQLEKIHAMQDIQGPSTRLDSMSVFSGRSAATHKTTTHSVLKKSKKN